MTSILGGLVDHELHVSTWNIRRRTPTLQAADQWRSRAPRLRAALRTERPTLLAVQEAMPDQATFVREALGPGHRVLGRGRDARGGDEACLLVVDEARLEVLDWWQQALSAAPDRPGSRGWGNVLPRVLVAAELRDRATGTPLLAVSTHLSLTSQRARLRSVAAIRELVAERAMPAVVMGDLNAGEGSPTVRALLEGDLLRDAWAVADDRATPRFATRPAYRPPRERGRRIDWILVGDGVHVRRTAIDGRAFDGGWPSDHLGVHAAIELAGAVG
ncbi:MULTISPECIES: endonuclease/exonuclease/phosphatase family protein [unclassified Agrococcus]|uniref:endonuclease/exonuclease/phosphatase family protein n=1 Tax=unclassified Agrococcus TaxID=2615065 RepID=UPI00361E1C0F